MVTEQVEPHMVFNVNVTLPQFSDLMATLTKFLAGQAGADKNVIDRLHRIEDLLREIKQMANATDDKIQALTDQVTRLTTVEESAEALLTGISAQLAAALEAAKNAGATPAQLAQLDALATSISQGTDTLAAAVTANTPAEPPVV